MSLFWISFGMFVSGFIVGYAVHKRRLRFVSQKLAEQVLVIRTHRDWRASVQSPESSLSDIVRHFNELFSFLKVASAEGAQGLIFKEIMSQMLHDINSPVVCMQIALQSKKFDDREKDLMVMAVSRLGEIVQDFSKTLRGNKNSLEADKEITCNLQEAVTSIVLEKKGMYADKSGLSLKMNIGFQPLLARISRSDFLRVLSNLIDNSVQALNSKKFGDITIKSRVDQNHAIIIVDDNGPGIPPEISKQIGERGVTYGKKEGQGLGLFGAKQALARWNGKVTIENITLLDKVLGTRVSLFIPLAPATGTMEG